MSIKPAAASLITLLKDDTEENFICNNIYENKSFQTTIEGISTKRKIEYRKNGYCVTFWGVPERNVSTKKVFDSLKGI